MKRKTPPNTENPVSTHFSVFWASCMECDYDFRLESGWKLVTQRYHYPNDTVECAYICNECGVTLLSAERIAARYFKAEAERTATPPGGD